MAVRVIAKCTPSLGEVSLGWARASELIFWPNNHGKLILNARDWVGGEIAETRNAIVETALECDARGPEVSALFWLDDDVLPFPGVLLELLNTMEQRGLSICSGTYFTKYAGNGSGPLIYPEEGGGTAAFVPDQVQEVWGHGMGLTLVRLEVYKRIRDELLTRTVGGQAQRLTDKYGRPQWYHTTDTMTEIHDDAQGVTRMGCTEDIHFLMLAHQLGYKTAAVTTKHAFAFHLTPEKHDVHGRRIREERGFPEAQFKQWSEGQPITWQTPGGTVVWD